MNYFRCNDVNIRKEYVKLVEDVRDAGGEVKIFSSMHISGQRKYHINMCIEFKKIQRISGSCKQFIKLLTLQQIVTCYKIYNFNFTSF